MTVLRHFVLFEVIKFTKKRWTNKRTKITVYIVFLPIFVDTEFNSKTSQHKLPKNFLYQQLSAGKITSKVTQIEDQEEIIMLQSTAFSKHFQLYLPCRRADCSLRLDSHFAS